MFKFIHGADFHLDSPFGALQAEKAAARRRESRQLAARMADYVRENSISLVLLAGDLFDSANAFRETGEQLAQALERMEVPVCIAPGNHDPFVPGGVWESVCWPDNVCIFRKNAMMSVELPQWNAVVHGAAFTGPEQGSSLLAGFHAPADGRVHLGLLHGEAEAAESRYDPLSGEEIAASGLAYLALGHIHKRGQKRYGDTLCAWPGCPEGRGFDELGEKGFYEGTVADSDRDGGCHGTGAPGRRGGGPARPGNGGRPVPRSAHGGDRRGRRRGRCHPGGSGGAVLRPGGPGQHPYGGGRVAPGGGGLPAGTVPADPAGEAGRGFR